MITHADGYGLRKMNKNLPWVSFRYELLKDSISNLNWNTQLVPNMLIVDRPPIVRVVIQAHDWELDGFKAGYSIIEPPFAGVEGQPTPLGSLKG
jgi:hypothetical protein